MHQDWPLFWTHFQSDFFRFNEFGAFRCWARCFSIWRRCFSIGLAQSAYKVVPVPINPSTGSQKAARKAIPEYPRQNFAGSPHGEAHFPFNLLLSALALDAPCKQIEAAARPPASRCDWPGARHPAPSSQCGRPAQPPRALLPARPSARPRGPLQLGRAAFSRAVPLL